jgi:hypothetical protein
MRWPQEPHQNAVTRRDDNLARTRRLSAWIAGGATAASLGLAAALGYALPGHSYAATTPAGHTGSVTGQRGATGGASRGQHSGGGSGSEGSGTQGSSGSTNSGTNSGTGNSGNGGLTPPPQPPSHSAAPPVVSSGGS